MQTVARKTGSADSVKCEKGRASLTVALLRQRGRQRRRERKEEGKGGGEREGGGGRGERRKKRGRGRGGGRGKRQVLTAGLPGNSLSLHF